MTLDRSVGPRCNIGPAEIARRRRSASALTVAAAIVAAALIALDAPVPARLAIFPFAAAAAITWLQVVHRFCVAFAALGLENFGPTGSTRKVDPAIRAADRRMLVQLVLEGSAIAALVTFALVLLPA